MISDYLKKLMEKELGRSFKDGFIPGQNLLKRCFKKTLRMGKTKKCQCFLFTTEEINSMNECFDLIFNILQETNDDLRVRNNDFYRNFKMIVEAREAIYEKGRTLNGFRKMANILKAPKRKKDPDRDWQTIKMHFHLLINKLSPEGFHVMYKSKKIDTPLSIPDALQVLKKGTSLI